MAAGGGPPVRRLLARGRRPGGRRAAAARQADWLLGVDPLAVGESRDPPARLMFVPPLAVLYRVYPAARVVKVIDLGWSGRPA